MFKHVFQVSMRRRYTTLLLSLVGTLLFALPLANLYHGELTVSAFVFWLILSSLFVAGENHSARKIALALLALLVPAEVLLRLGPPGRIVTGVSIVGSALNVLVVGMTAGVILNRLAHASRVTVDTFIAGICVYLLIGFGFSFLFNVVEVVRPGSFVDNGRRLEDLGGPSRPVGRYYGLIYFSFVTLTTVGYGDVRPVNDFARMLAVFEAIVGQIYLTTLVAIFVGWHVSQQGEGPRAPAGGG